MLHPPPPPIAALYLFFLCLVDRIQQ